MCNVQWNFAGHLSLPKLSFVFWLNHRPAVLEVYVQFWGLTGLNAHLWMVVWPNFSDYIHGILIEVLVKESGGRFIYIWDAWFPYSAQAKTSLFIYLYFSVMKLELTCLKCVFMFLAVRCMYTVNMKLKNMSWILYGRNLNVMIKYVLVYVISFNELGFSKVCSKEWKM